MLQTRCALLLTLTVCMTGMFRLHAMPPHQEARNNIPTAKGIEVAIAHDDKDTIEKWLQESDVNQWPKLTWKPWNVYPDIFYNQPSGRFNDPPFFLFDNPPLHLALTKKKKEIAHLFIQYGANINARDGLFNYTPLHLATIWGLTEIVQYLTKIGANIDAQTLRKWTPLHFAARLGYTDLVKHLIENGANINAQDKELATPRNLAANYSNTNIESALAATEQLLSGNFESVITNETSSDTLCAYVRYMIGQNRSAVAEQIMQKHSDKISPHSVLNHITHDYAPLSTLTHFLTHHPHICCTFQDMQNTHLPAQNGDEPTQTPTMIARKHNNTEVIAILRNLVRIYNNQDKHGMPPEIIGHIMEYVPQDYPYLGSYLYPPTEKSTCQRIIQYCTQARNSFIRSIQRCLNNNRNNIQLESGTSNHRSIS